MANNSINLFGIAQLSSPRQAANLFNPNGATPIRQKHLFVVRFKRAGGMDSNVNFVVKSIGRPQAQPQIEEMNQYNKKRIIHTGIKYSPIDVTFYDTADGAAMNMWTDYARYYFGDYNQDVFSYQDDILNNSLYDNGAGFGFGIRPTNEADPEGINSQHYFHAIEVFQVWGNEFTSYELVHPRITTFVPDELSYESSDASLISMSLAYEQVNHVNKGFPQSIFSDEWLMNTFNAGAYHTSALEVQGPDKTNSFVGVPLANSPDNFQLTNDVSSRIPLGSILSREEIGGTEAIERTTTSSIGGVLSRFGNYDFGSLESGIGTSLLNGVSQAIGGSAALANVLAGNFSGGITQRLGANGRNSTLIGSAVGGAVEYVDGLAEGLRSAAKVTGETPYEHADRANGLRISNEAVAGVNKTRTGVSQLGNRTSDK